jgi:hypothetical protein
MTHYYYPDGIARKCGSQIPAGAAIEVVKFLPKRRAIIECNGRRYMTSSLCCRKRPQLQQSKKEVK